MDTTTPIPSVTIKTKTFFGRLLQHIGDFFGAIFHSVMAGAAKTFDNLSPEIKAALLHGSGIIDIINSMLSNTPDEIRAAIKTTFPDVDEAALETGLFAIAHGFNLLPAENNLNDCIAKLQAYLSAQQGNTWSAISNGAAQLLAVILAPAGTKFGAIASLMEYVYQTFFKKK